MDDAFTDATHDALPVGSATMFRGNGNRDGVYRTTGPSEVVEPTWEYRAAGLVFSTPAVSNGIVYFGGADRDFGTGAFSGLFDRDSRLYAVDANDGRELWSFRTGASVFSSPGLAAGIVYFGSADGNVYALDATSGEEIWRFSADEQVVSSPAVVDGSVYTTTRDGGLFKLDAETGSEIWRTQVSAAEYSSRRTSEWDYGNWSSPAVHRDTVYCGGNDGHLYAIDAETGDTKWRFKTGGPIWATPAVTDGTVYVGSYDTLLYAVSTETGTEKWRFRARSRIRSSTAVFAGSVILGTKEGYVISVDTTTGQERWRTRTTDRAAIWTSSPVIAATNRIIYVGGGSGNHSAGNSRGQILAIDLESGRLIWQTALGDWIHSSPVVDDHSVYVTTEAGNLYVLR